MIFSGVVASSAASFAATGGTIVDGNGHRHHIFTSSGTFSVNQPRNLTVMVQDGGLTGTNGFQFTYTGRPIPAAAVHGGGGGASGQVRYISGSNFTGSITVTVGGGGGTSSLSTGWGAFSSFTASGGGGGFDSFFDSATGGAGGAGRLHTAVTGIWSGVSGIEDRSGGGGGGGYAQGPSGHGRTLGPGAQGSSFRGAGGQGQAVFADGNWNISSVSGPFGGNAGYVVISYAL